MKKFYALLTMCLITFSGAFAQSITRKYLFEEFSTEKCPNCPSAATYLHGLKVADPNLIMMVHHAGYYTDKFTVPENTAMLVFYNAGGSTYAPGGMVDRFYFGAIDLDNYGGIDKGPALFPRSPYGKTMIDKRKQVSPTADVSVNITGSYNTATKVLTATVSGNFAANFTGVGVSLWITEDNIATTTQSNGGANYIQHDVVRDAISDQWGDPLTGTTSGSTYTKTYTYTVNSAWVLANLNLVAFVNQIDPSVNKRTIHNAEEIKLSSVSGGTGIAENLMSLSDVSVYPNPLNDKSAVRFALASAEKTTVELYNALGAKVTAKDLGTLNAGIYNFSLDFIYKEAVLSKGIYLLKINAGVNSTTIKITM